MNQLLSLKAKLWVVIGLSTAISAVVITFLSHPLAIGALVGATELIIIIALSYSWPLVTALRLPVPGWLKVNLSGRWKGVINSAWPDAAGDPPEPIPVTFDINQSWLDTTFIATTNNMRTEARFGTSHAYDAHTRVLEIRYFFRTSPKIASAQGIPFRGWAPV